jgi:hypothetical protein
MIATEIPAAIKPYSIAVAAESSLAKRVNKFFMGIPWTDTWLPERIPGSGRTIRL